MDYKKLLEHSHKVAADTFDCPPESRLEYLGDHIFNFTTYDGEMSVLFAHKAVEVCASINNGTTFEYITYPENYKWFLLMCNIPFLAKRLEWGTSIRGAFWGAQIEFQSCGLWAGDEQLHQAMQFSREEWERFIAAVIDFAAPEMKPNDQGQRQDAAGGLSD